MSGASSNNGHFSKTESVDSHYRFCTKLMPSKESTSNGSQLQYSETHKWMVDNSQKSIREKLYRNDNGPVQEFNNINTNLETRNYIAKKVCETLDRLIKVKPPRPQQEVHKSTKTMPEEEDGIRLFTAARVNITSNDLNKCPRKRNSLDPRGVNDIGRDEKQKLSSGALSYESRTESENELLRDDEESKSISETDVSQNDYGHSQECNDFDITPEVKIFVAETLAQAIDRLIKSKPPRPQEVHEDTKTTPGAIDDGIRLFATAKVNITSTEFNLDSQIKPIKRRRMWRAERDRDSSSDEMEKLRSVAVSYEWVVSQSRGFCNAEGGLVTVDRDSFSNSTSKKCLDNIVSEFKKASLVRRNRNNRKKRLKN